MREDGFDPGANIVVRGAKEHNLRDIDVTIPRDRFTVITGLSGSGKSSLAFDTIYAEGQRRYVESLSAYARQFLGVMEKPDVDQIEGLSPSVAIEQRTTSRNPRSTVGTVTEVYDFLRLLWARAGTPHCPECGRPVRRQTVSQMADAVLAWPEGTPIEVLAPLVRGRKGEFRELFEEAVQEGFVRGRVDGRLVELSDPPALDKNRNHEIAVVVDRLTLREDARDRLADSLQTGLRMAGGTVEVDRRVDGTRPEADGGHGAGEGGEEATGGGDDGAERHLFSERYACPNCGVNIPELEPRQFSFNSPYGACPSCDGLGVRKEPEAGLVLGGDRISILEGVILPWGPPPKKLRNGILPEIAEKYGFGLNDPWGTLPGEARHAVLEGDEELGWDGVLALVLRRYEETDSDKVRKSLEDYMTTRTCGACEGTRLKPESRAVTVGGHRITEVVERSIEDVRALFDELREDAEAAGGQEAEIAAPILREVCDRLRFMDQVGLGYLTLARSAGTLSGGEAQRIRLATQIGSRLVGVLYVLDEPSIGLHQRDNRRLLDTLEELRDLGNTVLVVEHDEETIRSADHVVDMGPGAGRHGGKVLVSGSLDDLLDSPD
ncbi:MAG TPA: excinuclease ABC subunit UvrA, partial [Gemmatimonadota bacterium]|nr:excinuclease ABC subunit UvrA [Gemmatimonadota bacterium]